MDDEMSEAWAGLGLTYYYEDRSQQALYYLKRAIKIDPENDSHWNNLGHCYLNLEEYESCEEAYKKAFALDEACIDYVKDYVYSLYLNDKPDEALRVLDQQILEWEDEAELLALYAGILYEAGKVQRADEYLIAALSSDPEAYTTLFSYFFSLEENTHIQEIISLYK